MRCRHGAKAPLERCYEPVDRSGRLSGVGDDSADGGECVLDALVELGIQGRSSFLCSLALGDVDVDADHAPCVAGLVILDATARLDPPDRSAGAHNAILCMMLAAQLREYLMAALQELLQVIGMNQGSPMADRDFRGFLR